MLTISLHDIQIHAFIGAYEQEQVLGNNFEVDIDVLVPSDIDNAPFVDYVEIHAIVSEVFKTPTKYIEDVIKAVHGQLKEKFPFAETISIVIRKLNPPVAGEVSYAQVGYEG